MPGGTSTKKEAAISSDLFFSSFSSFCSAGLGAVDVGVNGGASAFNFFVAVFGVSAAPVPGGIDAADDSSMVFRFAIAMRCFASLAAFCFSSNSAFVFAMIASNSFLRFFASVAFCGVEVLAAAGFVVVVAVVVAGVDASGVFVVVAAAAAAEPKAVVGVPNGADGFPNGAATDLLPLPNAGVEVLAAPKHVDGFEPKVPPVVGVEVEVGDVPPVGLVANELKTEPKAGFAAKGAAEPNGDVFEAAAALPNGDAVVIGSVVFVVVGAAAAAGAAAGVEETGFFSSSFFAASSLIGEGAIVTTFGFSVVSFGFTVAFVAVAVMVGSFNADLIG